MALAQELEAARKMEEAEKKEKIGPGAKTSSRQSSTTRVEISSKCDKPSSPPPSPTTTTTADNAAAAAFCSPQTSEDRDDSYHSLSDAAAEHIAMLRSHAFFLLHVHLKQERDSTILGGGPLL
jgi:hypothetical protein